MTNEEVIADRLKFKCLVGSRAYGTCTESSDWDYRGVYVLPVSSFMSLEPFPDRIRESEGDTEYFELRKFFDLAMQNNPSVLEWLFAPDDCVQFMDEGFRAVRDNRRLFLTRRVFHTFSGYAHAQIKRARGQNKRVNKPQPEERPSKYDHCWFIPAIGNRPVQVSRRAYDNADAASLEHTSNMYRLYDNGKGVFRGPSEQLVCSSISKDRELRDFVGFLIFNEQEYEKAVKDWKQYWDWFNNRNEDRYRTIEDKSLNYDAKNMCQCLRLLYSCEYCLATGDLFVRVPDNLIPYLKSVRNGDYTYEEIMTEAKSVLARIEELKDPSFLPGKPSFKKLNNLYMNIRETYKEN